MAHFIELQTFKESRGILTVLDKILDFEIKRIFYVYSVDGSDRGGHRHHNTYQGAICLQGSCEITNNNGDTIEIFKLDSNQKCLIIEPNDWHVMHNFSSDAILLVLASTEFDPKDYIYEPYEDTL